MYAEGLLLIAPRGGLQSVWFLTNLPVSKAVSNSNESLEESALSGRTISSTDESSSSGSAINECHVEEGQCEDHGKGAKQSDVTMINSQDANCSRPTRAFPTQASFLPKPQTP
jgi:hypothetical protein